MSGLRIRVLESTSLYSEMRPYSLVEAGDPGTAILCSA